MGTDVASVSLEPFFATNVQGYAVKVDSQRVYDELMLTAAAVPRYDIFRLKFVPEYEWRISR